jgi:transcriptional regulator with XRE-family HTH domain
MPKSFDLRLEPESREKAYGDMVAFARDKKGKTLNQFAEQFGVSYWTMRNHVNKLVIEKRLEFVPGFGKATYYRAVDYNGMPEFFGDKLWYLVEKTANPETSIAMTQSTRRVLFSISQLFYYAGLHFDGGTVSRKDLNELKQTLVKDLAHAENWLENLRKLLNHEELFATPESLKKALMFDPDCPVTSKEIDAVSSNHRARYETVLKNP